MLPFEEVQTQFYQTLTPALDPVPVLDAAGPNQQFPYCTIGEFIAGESDTLNEQSIDLTVTVHVWSRQAGMKETQRLMTLIKDALDRQRFQVPGFWWVDTIFEYAQTLREADGETRHGIVRFRVGTFSSV